MNAIETDNYRTKDGEAYFTFSFFQEQEFIAIDVTYSPNFIALKDNISLCTPSQRGGFTIISEQKARDTFSARLVAGEWAESLWETYKQKTQTLKN